MQIQVKPQNVPDAHLYTPLIDERIARLAGRFPDIHHVHVTLTRSNHHQKGADEAALDVHVPGRHFAATKRGEEMKQALHDTFDAIEKQLNSWHEERRKHGDKRESIRPA